MTTQKRYVGCASALDGWWLEEAIRKAGFRNVWIEYAHDNGRDSYATAALVFVRVPCRAATEAWADRLVRECNGEVTPA